MRRRNSWLPHSMEVEGNFVSVVRFSGRFSETYHLISLDSALLNNIEMSPGIIGYHCDGTGT